MIKKQSIIRYLAMLGMILTVTSCDSFLEVDPPKSQLISAAVFEDQATANAALMDIYSKIREQGMLTGTSFGLSSELGNYADEMVAYGTASNPSWNFYNNSLLAATADIATYWNETYNQIYAANAIIEGAASSTNLSEQNKQYLKAEALFIRAVLHFYLVNLFGEVPYIKSTDYRENSVVSRMPVSQVYKNISKDLEEAVMILPENLSNANRVLPDAYTIKALLARVYLYAKEYAKAANEASSILNQTQLFSLETDPNNVFLLNSRETIWQLQSAVDGQNTYEGASFIFISVPPSIASLSDNLVNSFSTADLRRSNWIQSVSDGMATWYHAYKYKERDFTAVSKEYSVVFRLAEQYLIRAEARAYQGDLIGAKEDLNKIRTRAGLANSVAVSQQEIVEAVVQERRWELFTEFGHRFFDLKRTGRLDSTLSAVKPGWDPADSLFPIPQTEISSNPNLRPQNPGY